jgi:hypothetical protein
MLDEIKNIKTDKSEIRKFGITVGIVFGLIAGLLFWHAKESYSIFFILSTSLIVLGLVLPIFLKPVYMVWMTFAVIMGWIMTRVILSLLFFLLVTPIGLIGRLFGKDFMDKKFKEENKGSYWIKKEKIKIEKSDYERQF